MKKKQPSKKGILSRETITTLMIGTLLAFLAEKFLNPLFTFLYSSFLNIGTTVIKHFSDSTYKEISNGFSEEFSMVSMYILLVIVLFSMIYFVLFFKKKHIEFKDSAETYLDALNELSKTSIEPDQFLYKKTVSPPEDFNVEEEIKSVSYHLKKSKLDLPLLCVMMAFLCFEIMFIYSRSLFINSKVTVITNNIEIVSPYITDIKYKQLKADFHTIENKEDYDALITFLNDIAEENSIKLKK